MIKNKTIINIVFIFIISIISLSILGYLIDQRTQEDRFLKWEKVSTLSKRINSKLNLVNDLIKENEVFHEHGDTLILNSIALNEIDLAYNESVKENTYCSTKIDQYIIEVMGKRHIDQLFIPEVYGHSEYVPYDVFKEYTQENNFKCISIDAYTKFDENGKLYFLRPDSFIDVNEWAMYKRSTTKTLLYFVPYFIAYLLITTISFLLMIKIYYKLFPNKK